jgi:hypothetical protein
MTAIATTTKTTPRVSNDPSAESTDKLHLFLTRGLIAIAWAAVFAAGTHSVTTAVTVGVGVLLVLYPLIDMVASLLDAPRTSPPLTSRSPKTNSTRSLRSHPKRTEGVNGQVLTTSSQREPSELISSGNAPRRRVESSWDRLTRTLSTAGRS